MRPSLRTPLRDRITTVTRHRYVSLLTLALSLALVACGGSPPATLAVDSTTETEHPYGLVSSDPAVQYFHDQLAATGDDLTSDFGTYLSMLDMNPRDLQQDDPKHAHDVVLEKVRAVQDAALRTAMMQTFFKQAS